MTYTELMLSVPDNQYLKILANVIIKDESLIFGHKFGSMVKD